MPNNLKGYDFPQVLRSVFDVDKNCLRVCIVDGGTGGGPIEVIIDHTTDSIRLGDGTNLITATVDGLKVGLDVNVLNTPTVDTPLVTNVSTPVNSEVSHAFASDTKRFLIRARGNNRIQFSYISGQTGTNYFTIPKKNSYTEEDIINNGSLTIYLRTPGADTIEILEWA